MIYRRPPVAVRAVAPAVLCCTPAFARTAKNGDPASLSGLHDIVLPEPIASWWPLAPGWYLLAGLATLAVGWGLWRLLRRHAARRYRVEALAELRALRRDSPDPGRAVAAILVLLKRTALGAYPRVDVAALNGAAWWRFLDLTGGKTRFADGLGDYAEALAYARRGVDEAAAPDLRRLYRAAERWIRHHRPLDQATLSALSGDSARGSGA
jgi:hypothetical protein